MCYFRLDLPLLSGSHLRSADIQKRPVWEAHANEAHAYSKRARIIGEFTVSLISHSFIHLPYAARSFYLKHVVFVLFSFKIRNSVFVSFSRYPKQRNRIQNFSSRELHTESQ